MDFTPIDTTIPNLNRAVANNKEKKYERNLTSQFSHYSILLNLIIFQFFSLSTYFAQKDRKKKNEKTSMIFEFFILKLG